MRPSIPSPIGSLMEEPWIQQLITSTSTTQEHRKGVGSIHHPATTCNHRMADILWAFCLPMTLRG
ncbi:hypothetical protein V1264_019984 [Littorina saxatilis]|uniref:Uncharacterized protein n=1 Tax=Littorina saxatilis TaxID=31220 RepID=A0AAN9BDV5_9CAEN